MTPPRILIVAGSDSGGGAGIQADLKTFAAHGAYGMSVITALTAQNTRGVSAVHEVPPEVVAAQIDAVCEDIGVDAVKIGMLASAPVVRAVADRLRFWKPPRVVLDPVMVAKSGDRLLDEDARYAVMTELVPLCTLVTPNLDEAAILTGSAVDDVAAMHRAARMLREAGADAALVKGGHLRSAELVDVYHDAHGEREFRRQRIDTRNTHGTGCTLSAAIAALLAVGTPRDRAVELALDYVHRAIAQAPNLGAGNGPLNHLLPAHLPAAADS